MINIARRGAWACVAALALTGAACTSQQASTPQARASANSDQVLAAGTAVNVGQGTYFVPALPPSANESGAALTGDEKTQQWQEPEGRWIGGTNGTVYIPPTP